MTSTSNLLSSAFATALLAALFGLLWQQERRENARLRREQALTQEAVREVRAALALPGYTLEQLLEGV